MFFIRGTNMYQVLTLQYTKFFFLMGLYSTQGSNTNKDSTYSSNVEERSEDFFLSEKGMKSFCFLSQSIHNQSWMGIECEYKIIGKTVEYSQQIILGNGYRQAWQIFLGRRFEIYCFPLVRLLHQKKFNAVQGIAFYLK